LPPLLPQLPYQLGRLAVTKLPEPRAAGLTLQETVIRVLRVFLSTAPVLQPLSNATSDPQLEDLAVLMFQQMSDSGLLTYWEQLVLAVAEQLEQCNAAAAASAGGGLQAAEAAAASMLAMRSDHLLAQVLGLLGLNKLQSAAHELLLLQVRLESLMMEVVSKMWRQLSVCPYTRAHAHAHACACACACAGAGACACLLKSVACNTNKAPH
jgi:hypothetical protein